MLVWYRCRLLSDAQHLLSWNGSRLPIVISSLMGETLDKAVKYFLYAGRILYFAYCKKNDFFRNMQME